MVWERLLFSFSSYALAGVGVGAVLLLMMITVVTVAGRQSPWSGSWLMGGLELSELAMSVISCAGMAYCWQVRGHVRIGLVRDHVSDKAKVILDALAALAFLVFVAMLAWSTWKLGMDNRAMGARTLALDLNLAPFQMFFAIVMAHFALVLLRSCLGFILKASGFLVGHKR